MGKLLVVDSITELTEESGKIAAFTYAFGIMLADKLNSGEKCLIISNSNNKSSMLSLFGIEKSELGMEELVSYRIYAGVDFKHLEILPLKNKLYFLRNERIPKACFNKYSQYYKAVLCDLKSEFDLIIADMNGHDSHFIKMFSEEADGIVTISSNGDSLKKHVYQNIKNQIAFVLMGDNKRESTNNGEIRFLQNAIRLFDINNCKGLKEIVKKGRLDKFLQRELDFTEKILEIANFIGLRMALLDEKLG